MVRDDEIRVDQPIVLGVLNLTPDSFSDGGLHPDDAAAVAAAEEMLDGGADLIDVGGESTRPGARPVEAAEEWARVGSVISALAGRGIRVSVDTSKATVAERAADAGAVVLNDVSGLRFEPALADVAARYGTGLILMHMRGTPATMQMDTAYDDVIAEVEEGLRGSMRIAQERGCERDQLVVDPGIGFGKSPGGNLELIGRIGELRNLGRPILVGPSRKSFIGRILDVGVDSRVEGTIAACLAALERGAMLFRVHDVRAVRRALDVAWAVRTAGASVPQ
jgi:dihydropteroate synthase